MAALSPGGLAVFKLLQGVGPEEVDELIGQLSPKTMEFLRLISPSTNIDKLKARVLIMHDRGDSLVPSEESRRLADALAGDADPYHTEFSAFQRSIEVHVDDDSRVGPFGYMREAFKLFMHMYNVVQALHAHVQRLEGGIVSAAATPAEDAKKGLYQSVLSLSKGVCAVLAEITGIARNGYLGPEMLE